MVTQTTQLQQSRPAYYDRNPVIQDTGNFLTGAAPHALTTRASYTVPTGKKALVADTYVHVLRRTAATTALLVRALNVSGTFTDITARIFTNGVGDKETVVAGAGRLLLVAGSVFIRDEDLSVAGTCDFDGQAGIVEFDA